MSNGSHSAKNAILDGMSKPILRAILSAGGRGPYPEPAALQLQPVRHPAAAGRPVPAGRAHRPGRRPGRAFQDPRGRDPGKSGVGADGGHGLFLPGLLFQDPEPVGPSCVFFRRFAGCFHAGGFRRGGESGRAGRGEKLFLQAAGRVRRFSRPPGLRGAAADVLRFAGLPPGHPQPVPAERRLRRHAAVRFRQHLHLLRNIAYPRRFSRRPGAAAVPFFPGRDLRAGRGRRGGRVLGRAQKAEPGPGPRFPAHDPLPPGHLQERPGRRHFHLPGHHAALPARRLEAVGRFLGLRRGHQVFQPAAAGALRAGRVQALEKEPT